jgi:acyl-CoA thioester hydrolase
MSDGAGSDAGGVTHIWPIRVYFEDTDAGGVVYYANYLKFAERARTEMLRAGGFDHAGLADGHGVQIIVRRCAIDFLAPARLDDALEVRSRIVTMGGASFTIRQEIFRADAMLARAEVRLACVDRTMRPARLPLSVKHALEPRTRTTE